jgi:hypothetical protein
MENHHRNSEFSHEKMVDLPISFLIVYQVGYTSFHVESPQGYPTPQGQAGATCSSSNNFPGFVEETDAQSQPCSCTLQRAPCSRGVQDVQASKNHGKRMSKKHGHDGN